MKRKKEPAPKWESEAAMFAAFRDLVEQHGIDFYAEAGGHDALLHVTERWPTADDYQNGLRPGDVVLVEGKLKPTFEVLEQILPHRRYGTGWSGGDWAAVLVPEAGREFQEVAAACGVVTIVLKPPDAHVPYRPVTYGPPALACMHGFHDSLRQYGDRVSVPEVNVRQPAGLPSPRVVSQWKIDAVRLCMRGTGAELRTDDFRYPSAVRAPTFVQQGWMRMVRREGRKAVYELLDHTFRPDKRYPEVVAALLERDAELAAAAAPTPDPALVPAARIAAQPELLAPVREQASSSDRGPRAE